MGLEQIIPTIFLIAVLTLILPEFLRSNRKLKQIVNNFFIWSIIVASVVIVFVLILLWGQAVGRAHLKKTRIKPSYQNVDGVELN